MENASKALLIAGGILLAMLIMSLVLYVTTSMGDMAEAQDRRNLAEQIAEFNKSYEAYNKTRMYGTDVITVVNKAINHNKNIATSTEDPYYINVVVKTVEDFTTTGKIIDTSYPSDDEKYERDLEVSKNFTMQKGDYQLGSFNADKTQFQMYKGIVEFFSSDKEDTVERKGSEIYYTYSALTNFKRAIFKCESMDYNEKTGRINSITFTQIKS